MSDEERHATEAFGSEGKPATPMQDAAPNPTAGLPAPGTILADRYRLIEKIGQGGMGAIYRAEHVTIHKPLAIKILTHQGPENARLADRFLREARAASKIRSDHVVDITDFGETPDGQVFFAMEYLEGEDLSQLLERETRLDWPRACRIMLQILRALQAAHDTGFVHRDMKPENCYRITHGDNPDFIKLIDFGIAKSQSAADGITSSGIIIGTCHYMAPEQAMAGEIDGRTDVYSAGVILYELLTGQRPFDGPNAMAVLTKHMIEPPPLASQVCPEANIDPDIDEVISKALAKDPKDRFQSASEFRSALAWLSGGTVPQRAEASERGMGSRGSASGGSLVQTGAIGEEFEPPRGRTGLWTGLGLGAVLITGGAYATVGGGDETPAEPAPVHGEADPAPEIDEPTPITEADQALEDALEAERNRDYDLAIELYERAKSRGLNVDDDLVRCQESAGKAAYDGQQYEESLRHFEVARRMTGNSRYFWEIGQAQEALGNLEKAIEAYRAYRPFGDGAPSREEAKAKADALLTASAELEGKQVANSSDEAPHDRVPIKTRVRKAANACRTEGAARGNMAIDVEGSGREVVVARVQGKFPPGSYAEKFRDCVRARLNQDKRLRGAKFGQQSVRVKLDG